MSDIKIRQADVAEPVVRRLLGELLAELSQRYGGSGDDTPVGEADFTPPDGAFFVAARSSVGASSVGLSVAASSAAPSVAGDGERLIGCAGWRRHGPDAELKRMFTAKAARGRGIGRRLLATIEESARAAGCARLILETGDRQPEAIALYESAGYSRIEDFGFYREHAGVRSYAKPL